MNRHVEYVERAIARALHALREEKNPRVQADVSATLAQRARLADEEFTEIRSDAFRRYRDELGYSLSDLQREFGISRARAAQIATRKTREERT